MEEERIRTVARTEHVFGSLSGLPAECHGHVAFRIELDDHAAALIDYPDVVLQWIHAHRLRKQERVQAMPDFPYIGPILSQKLK